MVCVLFRSDSTFQYTYTDFVCKIWDINKFSSKFVCTAAAYLRLNLLLLGYCLLRDDEVADMRYSPTDEYEEAKCNGA